MSEISQTPPKPRRGLRRALRVAAWGMVVVGALALTDVAMTMLWQEPISALIASWRQESLEGQLKQVQLESEAPSLKERLALERLKEARRRVSFLAAKMEAGRPDGSAVGRIEIPAIKASFVLVKGTGASELEEGPGIYSKAVFPDVTFPGMPGTTAIAGHRTTFLEPFRHIDELRAGERIILAMPYARLTYVITGKRVVLPTDVTAAVARVPGAPRLVLSACTPLFSAQERLLVYSRLRRVQPRGAALLVSRHAVGGMLGVFGDAAQILPSLVRGSHAAAPITSGARIPPFEAPRRRS